MALPARILLGWPIYSDIGPLYSPVLSRGSWSLSAPLTNVQDRRPTRVARSLDALITSTTFDADLLTPRPIRAVGLFGHNLTLAPSLVTDWPTVGDAAWAVNGTPTRAPGATTVNGIPLDLVGDDSGAASEGYYRYISPTFAGNGDKIVSFLVKKSSSYASHRVTLSNDISTLIYLQINIDFTAAVPVATILGGAGAIISTTSVGDGGYRIVARAFNAFALNPIVNVQPAPATNADQASLYIGDIKVWDLSVTAKVRVRAFSALPAIDWLTVGSAGWVLDNTPTRLAAATTVNGIPLDLIGDDNAAAIEDFYNTIPFTGNGAKVISFLVKRNSAYASHYVILYDANAVVERLHFTIDFTNPVPVVTTPAGVLLSVVAVDTGYRITGVAGGVVAANTNNLYVKPAAGAAADQASFYIGDIQAWNAEEPSLIYDAGFQEVAANTFPAGSVPAWHPSYAMSRLTAESAIGYPAGFVHVVQNDVPAVARYWRTDIYDTLNAAGYIEIGRLMITDAVQSSMNPRYGLRFGWEDLSTEAETDGGPTVFEVKPTRRVATMTWDGLPQDEALVQVLDLARSLGIHGQLLFSLDPTATAHLHRWSFPCTMRELSPLEFPDFARNSWAAAFREDI